MVSLETIDLQTFLDWLSAFEESRDVRDLTALLKGLVGKYKNLLKLKYGKWAKPPISPIIRDIAEEVLRNILELLFEEFEDPYKFENLFRDQNLDYESRFQVENLLKRASRHKGKKVNFRLFEVLEAFARGWVGLKITTSSVSLSFLSHPALALGKETKIVFSSATLTTGLLKEAFPFLAEAEINNQIQIFSEPPRIFRRLYYVSHAAKTDTF